MRKPVVGYEGIYEVDATGRVFRVEGAIVCRGRWGVMSRVVPAAERKPQIHRNGYRFLVLSKNGKTRTELIHRLVANAFLSNPDNLPEVNHEDGDKTNNAVNNLKWVTKSQNAHHKVNVLRLHVGDNHPNAKVTEAIVREIRASKETGVVLAARYGISRCTISVIKNGKAWRHVTP
jgi:septin family protein